MVTTEFLHSISNIVKLTQLSKEANLNYQTLISKIRERRDLTTTESKLIEKVLKRYKLYSDEIAQEFDIENYKHLSAVEIMYLEDESVKEKILEYYSAQASEDYELLEGDLDIQDY